MAAESELEVRVTGRDQLTPQLAQIESKIIRFVGAVSSALTAIQVVGFPVAAIREFEAELAGVQKTTGFTDYQIKDLSASLVDMSRKINVSAADLAKIAAAAGQQGLGTQGVKGITQFTESVSRMSAVLDVSVEEAGTNIGKIASIFKIPLRDIENAVSSFNEVSNNSTASGEQLLDVVKRIGDAAGSLDLSQSIGLSATGIDLGLSPEVVGSSFQKVFAEMYARADQFSKMLGVSTSDWIKSVQSNGIDALKTYLDALRKMTPEAQQQTIKALSGGGRIGALVTKLVQDAENTILDTNVANAVLGIETGTSAIKEQLTVLGTLDAQIIKAGNSFKALGINAGEEFAGPLAAYMQDVNKALADPAVMQFAEDVGKAFLDMFDVIAGSIKFVAALNINWGNFITAAKVFVALKLANVILQSFAGLPLVGTALRGVGLAAMKSAEDQVAASSVAAGSITAQYNKIKELLAIQAAQRQSVRDLAIAEQQAATARAAQFAAETRNLTAATALRERQGQIAAAQAASASARSAIPAAQAAGTAAVAGVNAQLNTRLEQAEQQHQARLAAIVAQGEAERNAARAAGSRAGVMQANRDQAAAEALERQRQTRSLTGIQAHYARVLQATQAAGAQQVAAARLAFAQSLSALDGVNQGAGFNTLATSAKGAAAALAQADAAVVATTARVGLLGRAAQAAGVGMALFGTAIKGVGALLRGALAVFSKAFFWITIIYTALDAFGALDSLGDLFKSITDGIGLTSEASRKKAESDRIAADEAKKHTAEIREQIKALQDLRDVQTGEISKKQVAIINNDLNSDDLDQYKKGLSELVRASSSATAELQELSKRKIEIPIDIKDAQEKLASAEESLAALATRVKNTELSFKVMSNTEDVLAADIAKRQMESAQGAYAEQLATIAALKKQLDAFGKDATKNLDASMEKSMKDAETLAAFLPKILTPQSADILDKYAEPYLKALEVRAEAEAAYNAKAEDAVGERSQKQQDADNAELKLLEENQAAANRAVIAAQTDMGKAVQELKDKGGLSDAVIGSLDSLSFFFNFTKGELANILDKVRGIKAAGGTFTGEQAAPKPSPTQGTNGPAGDDAKADNEARRLRKARIELARAQLQSIADLEKQANTEKQARDDDAFDRNLTSFKEYYAARLAIQQDNIDADLRLRRDEISALNKELGEAKEESEKVRTQAQIVKAQGDIDVMIKQRAALADTTMRDMRRAVEEFTDNIAAQKLALAEYFGAGSNQEAYSLSLATAENEYRDFVARLTAEAANMPELLPMIDNIKLKAKFEAIKAEIDAVDQRAAVSTGVLEVQASRVQFLQEQGMLTNSQAAKLNEENRKAQADAGRAAIEAGEARLRALVAEQGAAVKTSLAYQQLALDIAKRKEDVYQLENTANEVALQINQDLQANIKQGLIDLSNGDFKEAFENFLLNTLNSLTNVAAEELSQSLVRAIGSTGDGGLGGFFSSLAGMAPDTKEITDKTAAVGKAAGLGDTAQSLLGEARGATAATPLYVQDVSAALGVPGSEEGTSLLGGILGGGKDKAKDGASTAAEGASKVADTSFFSEQFGGLIDTFKTTGTDISGSVLSNGKDLGTTLSGAFSSVGTLLMTGLNAVVAAIFGQAASDATASAVGSVAGAAAHNGGIAGRTTMRRTGVNPSVFASAVRYHTGGQVGLAPNEVPIIAERGEEVLTKKDPRHRDNLGSGEEGSQVQTAQDMFRVQPVMSESVVLDAMKGAAGQKLLLVHISKAPNQFKQALKL